MKKTIILTMLLLSMLKLWATTAHEGCIDFTDLTASYVEPYASGLDNENVVVEGRHTLIEEQGTDPRTDNQLELLPIGESKVIKLGNEHIGAESESLTYHIIPTSTNNLFMVKFAVVLEEPKHLLIEQPYFSIKLTDTHRTLLPGTYTYEVYAKAELEGFQSVSSGNSVVIWKDWDNVLIDLSKYIGQEILITFKTRDCTILGHYGYCYFTGNCITSPIEEVSCDGNIMKLTLQKGYKTYQWNNGDTTDTYRGDMTSPIWCDVTTQFGNKSRIYVRATDKTDVGPNIKEDIVCEGYEYEWEGFPIDTRYKGTREISCIEVDKTSCTSQQKKLELSTIPTYYIYNDTICEGEDYIKNGFNIKNPPIGILTDTIEVESGNQCKRWNVLNLMVASNSFSPVIVGDKAPCTNRTLTYTVPGSTSCVWTLPKNVTTENSIEGNNIILKFTNTEEGIISVSSTNGCYSGTATITIEPKNAIKSFKIDTICQGTIYNKNGWNLGVQNKTGYFSHIRQLNDSCGSSEVLGLYVEERPQATIKTDATIICPGQEVTLTTADSIIKQEDDIAIGDVLCTDGSILRFQKFLKSNKVAKGIVISLNNDEGQGYAIAIKNSLEDDKLENDEVELTLSQRRYLWYSLQTIINIINSELEQIEGADLYGVEDEGDNQPLPDDSSLNRIIYSF